MPFSVSRPLFRIDWISRMSLGNVGRPVISLREGIALHLEINIVRSMWLCLILTIPLSGSSETYARWGLRFLFSRRNSQQLVMRGHKCDPTPEAYSDKWSSRCSVRVLRGSSTDSSQTLNSCEKKVWNSLRGTAFSDQLAQLQNPSNFSYLF